MPDGDPSAVAPSNLWMILNAAFDFSPSQASTVVGDWHAVGGLPPELSNDPHVNQWGPRFSGDSKNIRLAPVEMTRSRQEVVQDIAYASNLMGGNLQTAVQIARIESHFGSNAHAGLSSAKGTFQIIDSTATDIINRILPLELPHTAEGEALLTQLRDHYNPFDSRQNAVLGVALLKYNHDMNSRVLGREATAGEDYMMHFSPLLAQKLRNGQGNEYLPANIAAANRPFAGMTIAQLANHFDNLMNVDVNPILTAADVGPDGRGGHSPASADTGAAPPSASATTASAAPPGRSGLKSTIMGLVGGATGWLHGQVASIDTQTHDGPPPTGRPNRVALKAANPGEHAPIQKAAVTKPLGGPASKHDAPAAG